MIKIYEPGEKNFYNNGLGTIETLSCVETKKASLEGWFLEVTVDTKYNELIQKGNIVYAQTKEKREQAFRIGNPKKTDRKITFTAQHVMFDAENYILCDVRPTGLGPVNFLKWCNERTDQSSPFTIGGDAIGIGTNYFIRKTLFQAMQQVEETFDCMFDVDNFMLRVMKKESVGNDDGYTVAYGKNIQGVSIDESWDEVCTKILPEGSNELLLPETYLESSMKYQIPYTKVVKFEIPDTDENETAYTDEQKVVLLRQMANEYLENNLYPKISYTIKSDVPQELNINDTVHIKHPLVNLTANVKEYKYDCNSKRVKSLVFGNYDNSLRSIYRSESAKTATSVASAIAEGVAKSNVTVYDHKMQNLTSIMLNGLGLFKTEVIAQNGSTVFYQHNKPKLEDSNVQWTMKDGAFAVSTDYGKTWNAGLDADGNAVLNALSAVGINCDWLNGGTINGQTIKGAYGEFTKGFETQVPITINGKNYFFRIHGSSDNVYIGLESTENAEYEVSESFMKISPYGNGNLGMEIFNTNTIEITAREIDFKNATGGENGDAIFEKNVTCKSDIYCEGSVYGTLKAVDGWTGDYWLRTSSGSVHVYVTSGIITNVEFS